MNKKSDKPIDRRKFLQRTGALVAGGAIVTLTGFLAKRSLEADEEMFWQIDPNKCIQCVRCETDCVLPISAVKCVHAVKVCGYCDLCGGYFRQNVKNLNTGAENLMCPTGAIVRTFVEEPYFEYSIEEEKCIGCGLCVKGCNSFGNGSLYLQIKQELCTNCNECAIARVCPSDAIQRVPHRRAYDLKVGE